MSSTLFFVVVGIEVVIVEFTNTSGLLGALALALDARRSPVDPGVERILGNTVPRYRTRPIRACPRSTPLRPPSCDRCAADEHEQRTVRRAFNATDTEPV